mmetsp:Transcript_18237/g.28294  ORF Transcript_18237/g.28294 Transcript_18237/m.28294 type:complete len:215 (+) Transcript_18237:1326-1970(+)
MPEREAIWKHYIKAINEAPDMCSGFFVNIAKGPAIAAPVWLGDDEKEGQEYMDKNMRNFGFAVADDINSLKSYHKVIQRYASGPDGSGSEPAYVYVKGNLIMGKISEELAPVLTKLADEAPSGIECTHVMSLMGGQSSKVPLEGSAVANRSGTFWIISIGKWKKDSAEDRKTAAAWVRKSHEEIYKVVFLHSQIASSIPDLQRVPSLEWPTCCL